MYSNEESLMGGSRHGAERASPHVRRAVHAAVLMSAAVLSLPRPAGAAEAAEATLEEVKVTGTRVVRDGYEAPTPVSVVTAEELESFASTNIADVLKTLPAIVGSTAPETMQVNASSGNSGINALNLRSIGSGRTLTLVNGQRIVGSSETGLVDVNTIPQELVKRVEVVTGGASASWGSDAMGGAVNFILDEGFTGLKFSFTGGTTTYGDNGQGKATVTGGSGFAGGRGHVLFSGSFSHADPVIYNTRDWNLKGWQRVTNPDYGTGAGQSTSVPNQLVLDKVSTYQGVIGGVIGSGPLRGTAFGADGVPYQIEEGWLVQGGRFQQGSPMFEQLDIRGKHGSQPLASRMRSMGGFLHTTWQFTDAVTAGLMLTRNRSQTRNWAFSNEDYNSIAIRSGNPFIPDSVQQSMDDLGLSTIMLGSMHPDLDVAKATGDRTVSRAALSLDGSFGAGWHWNAYYQYGESKQHYSTPGIWNVNRLAKAYDAVLHPDTGDIVCRVTLTNPSDPCVPYNPMGIGVNTLEAVAYVQGGDMTQTRVNHMSQNVAAFSFDGTPFSLWAGEVSIAAGAEWRREWMGRSWVDDMSVAREWWAGNALPSKGKYNVKEAFLETVVPLAKDLPGVRSADLQAAVRLEDYSTAGTVTAWKLGATWQLVDGLTMRGSRSHDIRAPNLSELFANGRGGAPYVDDPWLTEANGGQTVNYGTTTQTVGNPLLKAEISDSWGVGLVAQPAFLPGFGAAVDYWDIDITDAIGSAGGLQTIVTNCFEGQSEYCNLITFDTGGPGVGRITAVKLSTVNNANSVLRGVDAEASYRFSPDFIPGNVSLRLLGTRFLENSSTSATGVKTDTVGNNTGSTPKFRVTFSANWAYSGWRTGLTARGVSAGKYNKYWIECSTDCPVSAGRNTTINQNDISGAIWLDGSVSKDMQFGALSRANLFLNVRNLLNKDPVVVASSGSFGDTTSPYNAGLYDVMGRVYSAGIRIEF
jgi:outer membrane receptor protein involved in Fe transport